LTEINGWLGKPESTAGAAPPPDKESVKSNSGKDKKGRKDRDKDKVKPAATKPASKEPVPSVVPPTASGDPAASQ